MTVTGRAVVAVMMKIALAACVGLSGAWWLLALLVPIMAWELAPARARLRERARLIRDCHSQHDALMCGGQQDAWAYFGHHQPAGIDGKISWCAPPDAFPTVSRVADVVPGKPAEPESSAPGEIAPGVMFIPPFFTVRSGDVAPDDEPLDDAIRNFVG